MVLQHSTNMGPWYSAAPIASSHSTCEFPCFCPSPWRNIFSLQVEEHIVIIFPGRRSNRNDRVSKNLFNLGSISKTPMPSCLPTAVSEEHGDAGIKIPSSLEPSREADNHVSGACFECSTVNEKSNDVSDDGSSRDNRYASAATSIHRGTSDCSCEPSSTNNKQQSTPSHSWCREVKAAVQREKPGITLHDERGNERRSVSEDDVPVCADQTIRNRRPSTASLVNLQHQHQHQQPDADDRLTGKYRDVIPGRLSAQLVPPVPRPTDWSSTKSHAPLRSLSRIPPRLEDDVEDRVTKRVNMGDLKDDGLQHSEDYGDMSPIAESYERGRWLLGLLMLQSTSSFVLDHYQELLRQHVVVTLFLTMLVGAGGNAGNQSAIKVIRGLATGRFTADAACASRVILEQAAVGLILGTALSAGGFVRVFITADTTVRDAAAISASLFLIVMTSVLLGSALPFGFAKTGVDPAHAGTTIQVAMDIVGVGVTCFTCSLILGQLDHIFSVASL